MASCNAFAEPSSVDAASQIVGHDGWKFAAPPVCSLGAEQSVETAVTTAWIDELERRSTWAAQNHIQYVHLCVPDKLSIMTEMCSASGELDTEAGSGHSVARWSKEAFKGISCLLDPTDYLTRQKGQYPLYWKSDTRWTPWSSYMAYQLLCGRLQVNGNNQLLGYPYDEAAQIMNLDQGLLPDDPELIRTYRLRLRSKRRFANELALYRETIDLNAEELSDSDFAKGAQLVFENRHVDASELCVVIFGDANSADSRTLLTGMLAETFAEVHFVWGEAIDYDYIDQLRPDVVITQCSERQMSNPPVTEFDFREQAAITLKKLKSRQLRQTQALKFELSDRLRSLTGSRGRAIKHRGELSPIASTRVLLDEEIYSLEPPGMVQEHGACADPETQMRSNPVTLTEINSASVYFNGVSWWVHDVNKCEVLRHEIPAKQRPFRRLRPYKRLPGTTLMFAASAGAHCYYHWMMEILPKLGLLEREGIALNSIDHFLVREITADWQLQTLARFGIDACRIVETVKQPFWRCDKLMHIDLNCGINLKMHRFIPQWFKHLYAKADAAEPRLKIYISRPKGVRRGISNEEQFFPMLRQAGFTIMPMEGLSVAEQASLLSRADVLMSPHGGALTNMVFCRPGITVIEIFSRHVFPYYYGLAANCGHQYHAILENPQEDYARLVNIDVAQSYAGNQHETAGLSFAAPVEAVARLLGKL